MSYHCHGKIPYLFSFFLSMESFTTQYSPSHFYIFILRPHPTAMLFEIELTILRGDEKRGEASSLKRDRKEKLEVCVRCAMGKIETIVNSDGNMEINGKEIK